MTVGGQRIDGGGAHAGFQVVMLAGALSALTTLVFLPVLRRRGQESRIVEAIDPIA